MSNSSLVSYTKLSPNHSGRRKHRISRITPHCVVGQCSVETLGAIFLPKSKRASCNYGIGPDGRIGLYCEEQNHSWCSSSDSNDDRAVTIEVASEMYHPYAMNEKAYDALIKLCVDICRRNKIKKLLWLGGKDETLSYIPKKNEAVLTAHRWFNPNKSCPGDWLYSRYGEIAEKVTMKLNHTNKPVSILYKIRTVGFRNRKNADILCNKIKNANFSAFVLKEDGLYKVQAGAFQNLSDAQKTNHKLQKAGFNTFITSKQTL